MTVVEDPHVHEVPSAKRATSARKRAVLVVACWSFLAVATCGWLYAASLRFVPGNSDGATVALEGQGVATGHVLLHGWSLSLDSFWSVDALVYALVYFFIGLRPELMNLVPAIIAAAVVCVGSWASREDRRGWMGLVGPAVVVAILALPSPTFTYFFVQGPWHVATALWCLLAFIALARLTVWGVVVAVVLFAAALLGDLQAIALGVVPAFLAGLVAMARCRTWRAGVSSLAAVCSVALAFGARRVSTALGAFGIGKSNSVARAHAMAINLRHLPDRFAGLFGVAKIPVSVATQSVGLRALHIVGLIAVLASVLVALVLLVKNVAGGHCANVRAPWRLNDVLVIAFLGGVVLFITLPASGNGLYARYLTASVVFGAIVAGRVIPRAVLIMRRGRRIAGVAAAACFAAFIASFAQSFTIAAVARPASGLGSFLMQRHLRVGIGDYWSASVTTLETNGTVLVRPVVSNAAGDLVRYTKQSELAWYAGKSFQFLVFDTGRPWGHVDAMTATRTFGAISHTYNVGTYDVLVFARPVHVSLNGATWY